MSDRRPSKLYKCEITPTYDEAYDPPEFFGNVISYPEATVDEVLAFVRRGVESGTIKGERRWLCEYPEFGDDNCMVDHNPTEAWQPRKHTQCGWHLCIPVSDGGSET